MKETSKEKERLFETKTKMKTLARELALVADFVPAPDVLFHSLPHEGVADGLRGGNWALVSEAMDVLEYFSSK